MNQPIIPEQEIITTVLLLLYYHLCSVLRSIIISFPLLLRIRTWVAFPMPFSISSLLFLIQTFGNAGKESQVPR